MKLLSLLILSCLSLLFYNDVARPFDQYGNICLPDEHARLDNFVKALQQQTEALGYIIVHAGKNSCINEAKHRAERAKKWLIKRGVKANRILVKDAGYLDEVQTTLWIFPKDLPAPEGEEGLDKRKVSIHKCVDKVFARVYCVDRE